MSRWSRIFLWVILAVVTYALGYATYHWLFPKKLSPIQQQPAPALSQ